MEMYKGVVGLWPKGHSWYIIVGDDGREWFASRSTAPAYTGRGVRVAFTGNPEPGKGQRRPKANNVRPLDLGEALTAAEAAGVAVEQVVAALRGLEANAKAAA